MAKAIAIPDGFEQDFVLLTRWALREKHGLNEKTLRQLSDAMPFQARVKRAELSRANLLQPGKKPTGKAFGQPDCVVVTVENAAAASARLQSLIEQQKAANAAKPDPYAGLSGFERQLAIAKARGITEVVRLPSRVSAATDTGMGMSSCGWAVKGGAAV